jgi:hypothetical protein
MVSASWWGWVQWSAHTRANEHDVIPSGARGKDQHLIATDR